ncbi:MAG TPA: DNA replication and repair protein RecF [Thermoanaerobaculia bacterium]|nr:DNA replication and repair protein RecF [Thermoanaerobaculia bacterium]
MLAQLIANGFRNLAPLSLQPAAGSHLLLGGNGAGKTSFLEAVYVLATTRSFRTSQIADCIRHGVNGSDLFHLEGEVTNGARARLEVAYGRDFRRRTLNGRNAPLAEHLAALPVVAWAAADVELLYGAPRLRRRFLDRGVVGLRPTALEMLGRYREALRQKRGLLSSGGPGLEAWNELLAGVAAELIARRKAYVDALALRLAEVLEDSGLPFPPVALSYRPSPAAGLEGAAAIAHSLERIADRERQRQLPLLGPHRDDLEIRWGEHEVGRVASAGERKALSLLLLAAHGRVLDAAGESPVYLLDDVDAELAPPTLASVWRVFTGEKGAKQLFASSNRPQVWLTLPVGTLWQVEAGRITLLE